MTVSADLVEEPGEPPLFAVSLWPHRSLSPKGFAALMALTSVGMAIPVAPILGTAAFWVVLGFLLLDLALLYGLMKLTYRSGRVRETVTLWPSRLRIERVEPSGLVRAWEANPHWVRVTLADTRRIQSYLYLSSAGRDVELGAFLTPEERRALADTLRRAIAQTR